MSRVMPIYRYEADVGCFEHSIQEAVRMRSLICEATARLEIAEA